MTSRSPKEKKKQNHKQYEEKNSVLKKPRISNRMSKMEIKMLRKIFTATKKKMRNFLSGYKFILKSLDCSFNCSLFILLSLSLSVFFLIFILYYFAIFFMPHVSLSVSHRLFFLFSLSLTFLLIFIWWKLKWKPFHGTEFVSRVYVFCRWFLDKKKKNTKIPKQEKWEEWKIYAENGEKRTWHNDQIYEGANIIFDLANKSKINVT